MKLLLDTHIWIWYLLGNLNLSDNLQKAISDERNELWLSICRVGTAHQNLDTVGNAHPT